MYDSQEKSRAKSWIYFSFYAPHNWKCLVMLKDAYNTRRREAWIHYHSDRINKQMSSLPGIRFMLSTEINKRWSWHWWCKIFTKRCVLDTLIHFFFSFFFHTAEYIFKVKILHHQCQLHLLLISVDNMNLLSSLIYMYLKTN
jgi:hypothetical protein